MDEPYSLVDEWRRKGVYPALDSLFDEIWVYGRPELFDPLTEIPGMAAFVGKTRFTGYLRRTLPDETPPLPPQGLPERDYILVTTGGGGDGQELVDWVIGAYEHDPGIPTPALILLGPFMHPEQRAAFVTRAAALPAISVLTFEAQVERLYERALGVVAMGGYNTFCEILSFEKPALIVPRTVPRLEQHLRAERAEGMGLVRMLDDGQGRDPARMAAALRALPAMPPPRLARFPGFLDGLRVIAEYVEPWLGELSPIHRPRQVRRRALSVAGGWQSH
jgi:predicted glycosyltransferase